jgi:hypothetical protein
LFEEKSRKITQSNALYKRIVFELEKSVHCDRIVDRLIRPKIKGIIENYKKNQTEIEKKMILDQYLKQALE